VSLKEGVGGNRVYLIISVFIIIVVILTVLFTGNDIYPAYVPVENLDGWDEDFSERVIGSDFFGLESWRSFTYRSNNGSFPAYITVTTMKTFFMINENDLKDIVEETIIEKASEQDIKIDKKAEFSGQRTLSNGHSTMFVIFNGTDESKNISEQVKFFGESWNCEKSMTSVICIGFVQITDNNNNNTELNLDYWARIIGDKTGTFTNFYKNTIDQSKLVDPNSLVYNVKCH